MTADALSQPGVTGHRRINAERITFSLTLVVFATLLAYGITVHEPWLDEAHSWLLARDASMFDLLTTYLRYEGHPPLWYLVLEVLTTLSLPYASMSVTAALIAIAGAVLLFRLEGVPLVIKVLLPFTYFVAYQYAIIARSYVLILPLMLAIIHLYPRRSERIWTFTSLLVLLSNVSVHALMLAGAFTLLYIIDIFRGRQVIAAGTIKRQIAALAVLLLNVLFIVLVLVPPADLAIKPILRYDFSIRSMYWVSTLSLFSNLYGDNLLSIAMLSLLIWWLYRRGVLLEFILLVAAITPIMTVYFNAWHEGLYVLVLFAAVLLGFARPARADTTAGARRLTQAVTVLFVLALIHQISWTWNALRYDTERAYSGSREAAKFIAAHGLDRRQLYGAGFAIIAVQPYFEKNIFANYKPRGGYAFLDWTTDSTLYLIHSKTMRPYITRQLQEAPEFFLVSVKLAGEGEYRKALDRDKRYRLLARFPGGLFWKTHVREREAFLLYGRVDALQTVR